MHGQVPCRAPRGDQHEAERVLRCAGASRSTRAHPDQGGIRSGRGDPARVLGFGSDPPHPGTPSRRPVRDQRLSPDEAPLPAGQAAKARQPCSAAGLSGWQPCAAKVTAPGCQADSPA